MNLLRPFLIRSAFALSLLLTSSLSAGMLDDIVFSDKRYACNIEAKGWVVTETQLREVFSEDRDPVQLTYRELYGTFIYCLVKLTNLQCYQAWGTLKVSCPIDDVTLDVISVPPYRGYGTYYLVPIGKCGFSHSELDQTPHLSFKWKKLYVQ